MNKRVIVFATLVVFVPVFYFVWEFHDGRISNDVGDWGAFSDYLNPFIALANLVIVAYLTFELHRYNISRDEYNEQLQILMDKPAVVISRGEIETLDPIKIEELFIKNAGKGAAINVIISVTMGTPRDFFKNEGAKLIIDYGNIGSNDPEGYIRNLVKAKYILIFYEDVMGNHYITTYDRRRNRVIHLGNDVQKMFSERKVLLGDIEVSNREITALKLSIQRVTRSQAELLLPKLMDSI